MPQSSIRTFAFVGLGLLIGLIVGRKFGPPTHSAPAATVAPASDGSRTISDLAETPADALSGTDSPDLETATKTSERQMRDFLTLIGRCDYDRHHYLNKRILDNHRMQRALQNKPFELPWGRDSVLHFVEQVFREWYLDALNIHVYLRRQDPSKKFLDYMDSYGTARGDPSPQPPYVQLYKYGPNEFGIPVVKKRDYRVDLKSLPPARTILHVRAEPDVGMRTYSPYDRWPERRQQQFKADIVKAVKRSIADLEIEDLTIRVLIWNTERQAWD